MSGPPRLDSIRRVILENAAVRAAAVPALAKFAARLPSLRPSIRVLIKRSLLDEDDEVSPQCVLCCAVVLCRNSPMNDKRVTRIFCPLLQYPWLLCLPCVCVAHAYASLTSAFIFAFVYCQVRDRATVALTLLGEADGDEEATADAADALVDGSAADGTQESKGDAPAPVGKPAT